MESQVLIILLIVVLVLAAVGLWLYLRKRQSTALRSHFGTEYDRAVEKYGKRGRAEAELKAREKRVEQLQIIPLTPADAAKFSDAWSSVQAQFVDSPKAAVSEADRLVKDLMQRRGYPVSEFEQRVADLSVNHPTVVENYRAARNIALRNQRGIANTEDLRQAVVYYRALFEELLEVKEPEEETVRR